MNHRSFIIELINNRLQTPVIIQKNYELDLASDFQLDCAIDLGSLMIDGLVDGSGFIALIKFTSIVCR